MSTTRASRGTFERLRSELAERNPRALIPTGLDGALVGITSGVFEPARAVYSSRKCVELFMRRDGMSFEDAEQHFSFNVVGAFVGGSGPLYIDE